MLESLVQTAGYYGYSLLLLGAFLVAGFAAVRIPLVRSLFLPGSLAAGALLLAFSPQVAGIHFPDVQLPGLYYDDWRVLPGLLINIVFACLFLARPILPLKRMWSLAGPQVAFGQTIAWGQYVIGGLLALFVLVPLLGMSPLTAALIEISFEGGHGTAAGLAPVFDQLGFSEGRDLAVGLATTSMVVALVSGILVVNWGRRKHHVQAPRRTARNLAYHRRILTDLRKEGVRVRDQVTPRRLLSHLLLVAMAVGIGWILHQGLIAVEETPLAREVGLSVFRYVPLFPLCMFGGMIAHTLWKWSGLTVSRPLVDIISAVSLSVLIATAVGTMSLGYIANHMTTFTLLAVSGIVWILFAFFFLAPRMFHEHWFQRGLVDSSQSMGTTATGLLFLYQVDPEDKTNAVEGYGYKQLLFEPFVGGGFVTALSMPLIVAWGLPVFTAVCGVIFTTWLVLGIRYFGRLRIEDKMAPERTSASRKPATNPAR
ncbi:MAG: sodium/glutamate symporter [Patescibacteria group bacterium]